MLSTSRDPQCAANAVRFLERGPAPHPEAQGHTPRSLAQARGEKAIVELLDQR